MRKVVFAINITADGFCSHMDGIANDELHEYHARLLGSAGTLLLGRTTYQLMVPFWPEVARNRSETEAINEFARRLFDTVKPRDRLQLDLVGSKTFQSGVVALHYRKHA